MRRLLCGPTPRHAAPLALLLLLLAAAAPHAHAQLDSCAANPTTPDCKAYTVPQAVLETDLSRLCASTALGGATTSGWPSACALWGECREERAAGAACHPLALLQTACNEPGAFESEQCLTCAGAGPGLGRGWGG